MKQRWVQRACYHCSVPHKVPCRVHSITNDVQSQHNFLLGALQLDNAVNRNIASVAIEVQLWCSMIEVSMSALHAVQQWSQSGSIAAATGVV